MTITVYGIGNCDRVKKARGWLEARGLAYVFHDYKKLGADPENLRQWAAQVGWERLLNRAGTTFRKLPEAARDGLDEARALALMLAHPSAIRRPVVDHAGAVLVGFMPEQWEAALAATRELSLRPSVLAASRISGGCNGRDSR